MGRKGFAPLIVIGIIAALVIVGTIGYFAWRNSSGSQPTAPIQQNTSSQPSVNAPAAVSSTTNPVSNSPSVDTSGWKTYENTEYGFSFQYPSTWTDAGNSITGGYFTAQGDQLTAQPGGASLGVVSLGNGISPQETANEEFIEPAPNYCPGSHIISANSSNTLYFVTFAMDSKGNFSCTPATGRYKYIFTNSNGISIKFSYTDGANSTSSDNQVPSTFAQIISTLKLIAETPIPPKIISDQYDLFVQTSSSQELGYDIPQIQYADGGTIISGTYAGYHRLLAGIPADAPPGGDNIIQFATKDYKTYISDTNDISGLGLGIDYNTDKVVGFGNIPTDSPAATISLGSFVLIQDQNLNPIYYGTAPTSGDILTSQVSGLTFYADPARQYTGSYSADDNYLGNDNDVLVKTASGPLYSYFLISQEEFKATNGNLGYLGGTFYQNTQISSNTSLYKTYGQVAPGACGGLNTTYILKNISQNDLIQIGTTTSGVVLYTLKNSDHPLNHDEYNSKVYQWADASGTIHNDSTPGSYAAYVAKNPVLVFQDPWGRWTGLGEFDNPTPGGCGKPVIYFYPPKPMGVTVSFLSPIRFTTDIPTYENEWNVLARPDGELKDLQPQFTDCAAIDSTIFGSEYAQSACLNNDYPYLYWAGQASGRYPASNTGWVISRENISSFLNDKLTEIGLTNKEKTDMMGYWIPELLNKNAPYYRLSFFQTQQMNDFIPMKISPEPDTMIRVFLDWSPLAVMPAVQPQPEILQHIDREGFTVVEWGGLKQ